MKSFMYNRVGTEGNTTVVQPCTACCGWDWIAPVFLTETEGRDLGIVYPERDWGD